MRIPERKSIQHAAGVILLSVCIVGGGANWRPSVQLLAAPPNFWAECGSRAGGCDTRAIRRFYREYARSALEASESRPQQLERLAGGAHAVDPLLKAFLAAGYEVQSRHIRNFSGSPSPDAIWLYSEPGYSGTLREHRTDAASLPDHRRYQSIRVGQNSYAELFSEANYAGARLVLYSSAAELPDLAAKSLKFNRKADIRVEPLYNFRRPEKTPREVIGMAARVSLERLKVDIATEHEKCDTPCDDSGCPADGGFFYDPVHPVYDPAAPEKSWYGRFPMQLMINTSYFKLCKKGNYHIVRCANGSGLLIRNGRKLLGEKVRDDLGNLLDAIIFWKNGRVGLFLNKDVPKDLESAKFALGGNWFFRGDEYRCDACHDPDSPRPRTALGLDESGRTLTIVVIQPDPASRGESPTGRELHALMRQMGAASGFMLDGGGSSQFVYVGNDGRKSTAPPGDKEGYRPVPSAFGIVGLEESR